MLEAVVDTLRRGRGRELRGNSDNTKVFFKGDYYDNRMKSLVEIRGCKMALWRTIELQEELICGVVYLKKEVGGKGIAGI